MPRCERHGRGRNGILEHALIFWELVPAKGAPQCAAISPGIKGCGLRYPCSPREIEAIEHLSFRFPAPTPFLFRARGTRAPTEAARPEFAPYQLEE